MHDTNRGGLDRHSDNAGTKVLTERTPAISGLIGSSPNFLAVVEQLGTVAPVDCAVLLEVTRAQARKSSHQPFMMQTPAAGNGL
jgi:hypothetical protein